MDKKDKTPKPPYQAPRGMRDLLAEDHAYFEMLKTVVKQRAEEAGFGRITTPIIESTELFKRSVGDTTDIVQKEMYTFEDRGGRSVTIRPELTAPVVRAFIQNKMHTLPDPVGLYYIESTCRYERPQRGRYREFWQLGLELIGKEDPILDAYIISLSYQILDDLGLASKTELQINNLGCADSRKEYEKALVDYYSSRKRSLCNNCLERLDRNVLRLLDCKEEDCKILAAVAPKYGEFMNEEEKLYAKTVADALDNMGIPYTQNDRVVRGLDYYSHTVFEFWEKGKPGFALLGGGRYSGLMKQLGGQDLSGVGVGGGCERILELMREKKKVKVDMTPDLFLVAFGQKAKLSALGIIRQIQMAGYKTVWSPAHDSIKTQLKTADKIGVPYALIYGQQEEKDGMIILRNMTTGAQNSLKLDKLSDVLIKTFPRSEG